MSEPLLRIMYVSRAHRQMTHGELSDLLAGARLRNPKYGITGILLYNAGHFAQVLEGPVAAIRTLLSKVAEDPRHQGYHLVSEGYIDERYFEDWAMDWANLDFVDESKHVELRKLLSESYIADESVVLKAIFAFADDHRRSR